MSRSLRNRAQANVNNRAPHPAAHRRRNPPVHPRTARRHRTLIPVRDSSAPRSSKLTDSTTTTRAMLAQHTSPGSRAEVREPTRAAARRAAALHPNPVRSSARRIRGRNTPQVSGVFTSAIRTSAPSASIKCADRWRARNITTHPPAARTDMTKIPSAQIATSIIGQLNNPVATLFPPTAAPRGPAGSEMRKLH